ncbi:hypothetical protein CABS01_04237 [Colletotrichum abscissum]|uniref:uncharacterized protein n=1 Tax=Colletotrichum abscissum TaxID=1671311 RepID=UPI0027D6AEA2|nr:uncharacterized protein CABS01_04237 [Colletotrichum abscissum]KAK1473575.1 hypothetical protein CABS01_04237 [Colletotrichum abscissum]
MGLRAPYCVHPEAVTKFKTILLRIRSTVSQVSRHPSPLDPRSSLRHGEAGSWICKRLGSQGPGGVVQVKVRKFTEVIPCGCNLVIAHCPKCAREKKDFWVVNMAACETYLVACSSSLLFSYFSSSFSLNCSKLVSLSTFFSKETIQTVC